MSTKNIVKEAINKKPKLVKEEVFNTLNQKAGETLNERKIEVAKTYLRGR